MEKISLSVLCSLTIVFTCSIDTNAQQKKLGMFDDHGDVGNPRLPGSVVYDPQSQQYTMEGAGTNMWAAADQFHFLWKKIKGDFIITATVKFIGKGTDNHRKIGL